jgi:hypothetical protein
MDFAAKFRFARRCLRPPMCSAPAGCLPLEHTKGSKNPYKVFSRLILMEAKASIELIGTCVAPLGIEVVWISSKPMSKFKYCVQLIQALEGKEVKKVLLRNCICIGSPLGKTYWRALNLYAIVYLGPSAN